MGDAANKSSGASAYKSGVPAVPPVAATSLPDLTGRTLGDYHILRRLGVGGMGQVYLARQLSLKREVALKLLRDDLNKNLTALMRFQAEAEAVAKLNHPNIVHIHQMGEADGLRYMALEYVEGRNLRDHLARKGPPDLPVSLSIIRQVVNAIQQAHEHGIVHRDIKPENILVTRKVEVKVTDFGLSRFFAGEGPALNLTQSGVTLGTPLYMSPEQVQGHTVDHRSDIYSLGVTCYHLLAGEPPFRGATAFDVALKHVQDQPPPLHDLCPDLPVELCAMVHKMMAKHPADRYATARDILKDLARVRDAVNAGQGGAVSGVYLQPVFSPSGAIPTPAAATHHDGLQRTTALASPRRPRGWARWALAGALCLLAATGGAIYSATRPAPPPAQPDPAPTNPPPRAASNETGGSDAKAPEKIVPQRERELIKLIDESAKPEEVVNATIELGLLYVRERRLDEANDRFEKLRAKTTMRGAVLAGRLGQAIVTAYRDQKDGGKTAVEQARASNDLFVKVINDPFPNTKKEKNDKPFQATAAFLQHHLSLSQAVSEALNRNMITLGLTRLDPPALELLRAPLRSGMKP